MFATPPDLAAALLEELKWEGLDWGKRTSLKQSLDQDSSRCWVQSGGCAVISWCFACCHLSPCSVSPHAVVCCCSSSERTHHWLWFPKVTEGYPPAPRRPRTLAKGQHQVYCFIKYGKDGYCMALSGSARLCEYDGPALVPSPEAWPRKPNQQLENSVTFSVTANSNRSCLS